MSDTLLAQIRVARRRRGEKSSRPYLCIKRICEKQPHKLLLFHGQSIDRNNTHDCALWDWFLRALQARKTTTEDVMDLAACTDSPCHLGDGVTLYMRRYIGESHFAMLDGKRYAFEQFTSPPAHR